MIYLQIRTNPSVAENKTQITNNRTNIDFGYLLIA